ncbi:hypothetical protein BDE02_17G030200 [Populus trichocarpa]|nr:hypothetical protein BDE02_17G030200 [Populus trichocarpa]
MTRNSCLMDLLGRAGHLEEAHALIMNMEVAPISDKWAALQWGDAERVRAKAREKGLVRPPGCTKKAGFKPKTSSVSYNVEEVKMKILLRAL